MRSVEEALKTVLDNTKVLGTERISIQDAHGRVLAEDVTSGLFHQPWDNSAMDGFAVRWDDIKNASKESGVMAMVGKPVVYVYRRPKVMVLATGDELADLDEEITENKIPNSNGYTVAAQVIEAGGIPHLLGIARDNKESLREKIGEGLGGDMLLVSGGVSVGMYDFVKDILKEYGIDMKFWTVGIRPGHPIAFGLVGDKPIFGLPGNPVSTMVTFEVFARPALLKMSGHTSLSRPMVDAVYEGEFRTRPGRTNYVRAITRYKDGKYYVRSTGDQGSGILISMSQANSFMVLPPDTEKVLQGEAVKVQLFAGSVDYS